MTDKQETGIALTDTDLVLTAVAGQRIPRRAWSSVKDVDQLITEAQQIVANARDQAESMRQRAYAEGQARGLELGQAEAVRYVAEAQRQAREFIEASEGRIIALVVSIVQRIAPQLNKDGALVAAMAAEALKAVTDEQYLRVNVDASSERATRSMLEQWQQAHPEVKSVQVAVDPHLEPFACVVKSELGRIEVRLSEQLEAVRERLLAASVEPRT